MRSDRFAPSRANGMSDRRVVLALVENAEPGALYDYETLRKALSADSDREFTRAMIGAAVRAANSWLLRERQRVMHAVPGVGYRVAQASEHQGLALVRKRRADVQLRRGVDTLKHVRWDEMDANARAAHEGTLMLMGGLYAAISALDRRQTRIEALVAAVKG